MKDGSIALGMLPTLPFVKTGEAQVDGGMLLSYTDGLIEQEDAYGAAFETAPLERALKQFSGAGPQAVNETLIANFEAHRSGLPYSDDIALLTCRFA